jgi:hypothetical protein
VDDAAPAEQSPPEAPPPEATVTVAPTEVVLELPAPPYELRSSLAAHPSPIVPGVETDGLDALDSPLLASAAGSLDSLRAEALRHLRQEGSWRLVLRALGILLGVLLAFRLAFDEALPRLLMAAVGGAAGLALVVLLLHYLNETRRQENLLAALTQITTVAREHPAHMAAMLPHLEAVLTALCSNVSVWPSSRPPDALARVLTRALADADPPSKL